MFNRVHQALGSMFEGVCISFLVASLVMIGVMGLPSPSLASSKAATTAEMIELSMSEAAQEFVESILDDYSDALEDSFDASLKPMKSVMKDLTKQLSKASASSSTDMQTALAPQLAASQEALQLASTSFETLMADTEGIKAALASAPTVLEEAIQTQITSKFDVLEQALTEVSEAIQMISEDTMSLQESDSETAMTAYTEHATMLSQAIEAASLAIDSFDD